MAQITLVMKNNPKRLIVGLVGLLLSMVLFGTSLIEVLGIGTSNLLSLNAGAASVMDSGADDDKSERIEGSEKTDKSERSDKSEKSDRSVKTDKSEKSDKSEGSVKYPTIELSILSGDDRETDNLSLMEKIQESAVSSREKYNSDSEEESSSSDKQSSSKEVKKTVDVDPVIENEDSLVMANVQDAVNVRTEPSEEAPKAGKLYRDCAGEILERRDGWTRLKSGNVTGWTKDEFLLFGDDAKKLAHDVGNLVAKVHADGLRVRKEATEESGILGFVENGEDLNALEIVDNEWVSVEYEGDKGYISAEFVSVRFVLDKGESIQEIKAREEKEAEALKKASEKKSSQGQTQTKTQNRGAVQVDVSDAVLLGALIQCEAGNQSYEGQLAVGAVVMNRVRSGGYPSTVSGVIYASGQFSPAQNGRLASRINSGVKASCMQAAQAAIAGSSNVGGATHFRRTGSHEGIVIGDHVFW